MGAHRERAAAEQGNAWYDAAPAESVAEFFAASRLPALDRADRPAQMPRRLLVAASFEIAEHNGRTITLGEHFDLGVKETIEIIVFHGLCLRPSGRHVLFMLPPASGGQAARDAVR